MADYPNFIIKFAMSMSAFDESIIFCLTKLIKYL